MEKVILDEIKFLRRFIIKYSCDIDYIMNGELEDRIEYLQMVRHSLDLKMKQQQDSVNALTFIKI